MARSHYEHDQQTALFAWAAAQRHIYPPLQWLYAIPNSARRSPRHGAWMRAEGMRRGVWDIHLPCPTKTHAGLWIEMKSPGNKLTPDQTAFRDALSRHYVFSICYNWMDAKHAIISYLQNAME